MMMSLSCTHIMYPQLSDIICVSYNAAGPENNSRELHSILPDNLYGEGFLRQRKAKWRKVHSPRSSVTFHCMGNDQSNSVTILYNSLAWKVILNPHRNFKIFSLITKLLWYDITSTAFCYRTQISPRPSRSEQSTEKYNGVIVTLIIAICLIVMFCVKSEKESLKAEFPFLLSPSISFIFPNM